MAKKKHHHHRQIRRTHLSQADRDHNDAIHRSISLDDQARRELVPILRPHGVTLPEVMNMRVGGDLLEVCSSRILPAIDDSSEVDALQKQLNDVLNGSLRRIRSAQATVNRLADYAQVNPFRWRQFRGISDAQRSAEDALLGCVTALCLVRAIANLHPEVIENYPLFQQPDADFATSRWLHDKQPTYFVDTKLFESILQTVPPEDEFSLTEFEWPAPAFALLLDGTHTIERDGEKIHVFGYLLCQADREMELSPELMLLDHIKDPAAKLLTRKTVPCKPGDIRILILSEEMSIYACKEDELETGLKNIIFSLLYTMMERPQWVERGGFTKKIKTKGRIVDEWSPNYIGRTYKSRSVRAKAGDVDESGRSVRSHWRLAHWREQAVGPRSEKRHKRIRIDRVWVIGLEDRE